MKRILLLPLACMAATLLAQHHGSRGPLTAEQVKQQSLTHMINDEIQRRQQQASPEQYQQIAQQVSRQYSQLMEDSSQLDPRHTLPAMAAQAIEQKLDSVIDWQNNRKYTFQYDTDRQLLMSETRYDLIDGSWTFYSSNSFGYDAQNRVVVRDENYTNSEYHAEMEFNSWGMATRSKSNNYTYDDQHNVIEGSGQDYTYNSQGYLQRQAYLAYDPSVGFYENSATEYEYFDVPQGEYSDDYVRKTIWYRCPEGSFVLEAYERLEWQEDRLCGKREQYVNGRWYTTFNSYMDEFGLTLTREWYVIENGSARLSEKSTETSCGEPYIHYIPSRPVRCWTHQSFDASGNVTDGRKEDHLYGWSTSEREVDYYHWNSSTKDWEFDYVEYSSWYGEPYEGETRQVVEQPIRSATTQIYHNGQWETIGFWGTIEAEPVMPYGNSDYRFGDYRTLHYLSYTIDTNTGNYESYEETYNKFENGRQVSSDVYNMPNRAHLSHRYEYDYTPEGDPAETRYFNTETGSLELRYRDVYEYDPTVSTNQILHQSNTNVNYQSWLYYHTYIIISYNELHQKPLSVKRYDAAGNFMEDLTLYYYSSLHGDIDEGLPEITPDDPYGDLNPFLNLMGQPLASPLPGQPVIDVRHRQVIVR